MNDRRTFLKAMASVAAVGSLDAMLAEPVARVPNGSQGGALDRSYWVSVLQKLAGPVLGTLAKHELRKAMPIETNGDGNDRRRYSHLEAFGRTLAGIAPWLAARELEGQEALLQASFIGLAQRSLEAATDRNSPDFMNFSEGGQPLVDTAFLAQGILRAPSVLWEPLDAALRSRIVEALKSSRAIPTPKDNNWVMFAAMIEAALLRMGEPTLGNRLEDCVRSMLSWYKGDGVYGDGEWFHFDYYNSFVIHPMLLDVLGVLETTSTQFGRARGIVLDRARRYAEIQERLIAPDGTFPTVGRSATYRFGALQLLAQIALMRELPSSMEPAQVRCALTSVVARMIEAPGTFDDGGWLRIGFCGHQLTLAEPYISTGSLYLCSTGLLPLGLPPADPFWSDPPTRWTSQRLWSGESLAADHAIKDMANVSIPDLVRSAEKKSGG
jgi:hypothetical protein